MSALSLELLLFSIFMCIVMSAIASLMFLSREVASAKKVITLCWRQWLASLMIAIAAGLSSALVIGKVFQIGV